MTHPFKKKLANLTAPRLASATRAYMRHVPFGRVWLWNHFVVKYLYWREFDFTAHTVFGSKIVGTTVEPLQYFICYFGMWEPHITAWIMRRLRPGDVFIDVGANIGYYTLLAAGIVGKDGKVIAVEPAPPTSAALRRNVAVNSLTNVRVEQCAISHTRGTTKFYSGANSVLGSIMPSWAEQHRMNAVVVDVPTRTIADIVSDEELSRSRLIKIDVEGAEWLVLAGMKDILPSLPAHTEIILEVTPSALCEFGKTAHDVIELLGSYGFHPYRIRNDYRIDCYLQNEKPRSPERLVRSVTEPADLVFSRIDAPYL